MQFSISFSETCDVCRVQTMTGIPADWITVRREVIVRRKFLDKKQIFDLQWNDDSSDENKESKFSTDMVFSSRQNLIDWVPHVGKSLGYVIRLLQSYFSVTMVVLGIRGYKNMHSENKTGFPIEDPIPNITDTIKRVFSMVYLMLVGNTPLLTPIEKVARPPLWITRKNEHNPPSGEVGAGSFACATAPELSQNISIGLEILATTLRSDRKFLSQTASFAASDAAMYSASVVESAIVSCFELFHEIAPPFMVKTYPDCDLKSSLSVWKLASEYPVTLISSSVPPKTKNISFVLLRYLRMFLTATQWGSPGFCWYLLVTLTE
ncbi:hypothetical protein OSB04_002960 [Centaurea solstitialis]|uniref:Uncharacterized protein n=1 Tax=Centaurea solstitialis TaxID=347529 RepID=A0AA38TVR2_9ASTR|nr:hypothetical protein OSB04_002960 [Centaurea solstitialis]